MKEIPPPISSKDLERLKDNLIERIKPFFPFKNARFYGKEYALKELLEKEGLTPIQLSRANEALLKNNTFFDRITNRIFIPIEKDEISLGTLVLYEAGNKMGVDEAETWLPLLREHIMCVANAVKQEAFYSEDYSPPPYVSLCLRHLCNKMEPPQASILVMDMMAGEEWEEKLARFHENTWPQAKVESIGQNIHGIWFLLNDVSEKALSSGIKKAHENARKSRLRLKYISGCGFSPEEGANAVFDKVRMTQDTAAFLNSYSISLSGIETLKKKMEVPDLGKIIKISREISLPGRFFMLAFGRPVSKALAESFRDRWKVFETGQGSAFFLKSGKGEPLKWGKEMQKLSRSLQDVPLTLGILPSWKKGYKKKRIFFASVMSYLHALLLGRGSLAEFDAVTLNVAGDEYFSLGDLKRAKEAYALGLSLEPQNRKLLNSYGVCLAGLRERKKAVDVFLKSIDLYPDDFIACYNLGGVYLEQGKSEDAENILRKAHTLEPNDQRVAIKYAEALCEAEKYEKAIDILKGASQAGKKPCHYSWHRAMGMAYFHMPGAWHHARKAFQNAIKINPKDVESFYFLALGYIRFAEDRDTAVRLFRQTENFARDSARAKRIYGILTKTLDLNP